MPLAGVVCLVIAFVTPPVEGRLWTNTDGQTLEADFVRVNSRTAVLRAGEKTIKAPLDRLSEDDNAWLDRFKKLVQPREWGKPDGPRYQGQFTEIKNGKVRVKYGALLSLVPFEELSGEDWHEVADVLRHLEQEMPPELLALKPAPVLTLANGIAPADAVERSWTDIKGREIKAGYLGVHETDALLWMRDKEFKVPLSRLSPEDRRWIASQSVSDLAGSLQLAMATVSQVTMKAQAQGPPPPEVLEAMQPPEPETAPVPAAEPQPQPEPLAPAAVEPTPSPQGSPPYIKHVDELPYKEYEARLDKAFAGMPEIDYDEPYGDAYCDTCHAEFVIPEGFGAGRPCPLCGVAMGEELVTVYDDDYYADTSSSRPWYLSRWVRRLVITVVIAGIGVGVKIATGGD